MLNKVASHNSEAAALLLLLHLVTLERFSKLIALVQTSLASVALLYICQRQRTLAAKELSSMQLLNLHEPIADSLVSASPVLEDLAPLTDGYSLYALTPFRPYGRLQSQVGSLSTGGREIIEEEAAQWRHQWIFPLMQREVPKLDLKVVPVWDDRKIALHVALTLLLLLATFPYPLRFSPPKLPALNLSMHSSLVA